MKRAFHPILLGLYPIMFLYSRNMDKTSFSVALWPLLISLSATVLVVAIVYVFYRDLRKSALLAAVVLFLFYSYGHLHSWIYFPFLLQEGGMTQEVGSGAVSIKQITYWGLAFLWLDLLAIAIWKVRKIKEETLEKLTFAVNGMSMVLLAMPLITMVFNAATSSDHRMDTQRLSPARESRVLEELGHKPDIYLFMLDGYARQDVLETYFGFDNSDFIAFLEEKGFFVSRESSANYYWTDVSLGSSMNMEYVNYLMKEPGPLSNDRSRPYELIRNNKVARYLREQGYTIVHLDSTYGPTMKNPYADVEFTHSKGVFQVEFYRVLAESTMLKMMESMVESDLARVHLANMETLEGIASIKGPKLVFYHSVPPHHPYLFDRDGKVLRNATVSNQFEFQKHLWAKWKKYVHQTIYINKRIMKIVDSILSESPEPPIIIIHSDHGPHLYANTDKFSKINSRFAILMAILTPGAKGLFTHDLSPVNMFRILLNHYFEDDMPVFKNYHFISGFKTPYNFRPWPAAFTRKKLEPAQPSP